MTDTPSTSSAGLSRAFVYRQLAATVLLWLAWSFAFTLLRALIDGILEGRLPRPLLLAAFFVLGLLTAGAGARLVASWRGVLGIFAVILPVLTLALTLFNEGYPGGTETIAFVLASILSIGAGVLMVRAETSRTEMRRNAANRAARANAAPDRPL